MLRRVELEVDETGVEGKLLAPSIVVIVMIKSQVDPFSHPRGSNH